MPGLSVFRGNLDLNPTNEMGSIFENAPIGTPVEGSIDDATFAGRITADTMTPIQVDSSCCIAAGGLQVVNDAMLTQEEANLLNALAGSNMFTAGNMYDGVDIEGDVMTVGGGRIEVGVSYIFDAGTFPNSDNSNYPFDPNDVQLALFFVVEEDSGGLHIYEGYGRITVVPLPASLWLLFVGFAALSTLVRRKAAPQ
jgi:hypothetical protein